MQLKILLAYFFGCLFGHENEMKGRDQWIQSVNSSHSGTNSDSSYVHEHI